MVSECENIRGNQLACDKISVIFCGHNVEPGAASNIRLPVLIHSCPANFSTLDYFEVSFFLKKRGIIVKKLFSRLLTLTK